jgi:hypothetical protein
MRRALRISTLLGAGLLWAVGLFAGMALAGPASYDKETKSFRFRYTFANLPAGVQSVVGAVDVKPTHEQEMTVRSLVSLVSDVLNQVTQGRGKIGSADYVDDIKDADLVVSLVGAPSSPGWSTMKGSDGKPGQMVLYYQVLATTTKQDVVFTASHEICHYLFGLADEYNYSNFPSGCPPQPGPGCLMDNYRPGMRGFMGKLCDTNHNSQNAQVKSCKDIVDDYFAAHGVTETDPNITPFVPDAGPTVIAAAISQTRAEAAKKFQSSRSGSLSPSGLRSFTSKTLKTLIDQYNHNNGNKLIFSPAQLRTAIDLIAKAGAVLPAVRPFGLSPENFAKIKAQALALGNSPEVTRKKSDSSRFTAIKSGLRAYVRQMLKADPSIAGLSTASQNDLINQLAREESRSPQQKNLDRLVSVTNVQAELDLVTAENIITILDEQNAPGTPRRLEILNSFRKRFAEFSIPGRTSAGFGLRRTRFITPDPIDPRFFRVLTQAGVFSYPVIRDRGFTEFARLIDRTRMELVRPNFFQDPNALTAPLDPQLDRPYETIPVAELQAMQRRNNSNLQAFFNDILNQLERNRLENIAVLVPPGGLPPRVGEMLQILQTKLRDDFDVRLDVVMVGATTIPAELRNLSVVSHGSVLTVTDIDEIGAIAQRLKNEQCSGSWVTLPQQSTIPQRTKSRSSGTAALASYRKLFEAEADSKTFEGYDLQLMSSKDVKDIPPGVKNRIFVADVDNQLHFRVVDAVGNLIYDTNENCLSVRAPQIERLKKLLPTKLAPALNDTDKRAVINAVTSVLCYTPFEPELRRTHDELQDYLKNSGPTLTEPVRQRVDATLHSILMLKQILTDLQGIALSVGVGEAQYRCTKLGARLGDDSADSRDKVTPQFMHSISDMKVHLAAARKAIVEAKAASSTSAQRLKTIAQNAETAFGPNLAKIDALVRLYERMLEAAIETSRGPVPIFGRVDRVNLDQIRQALETADLGGNRRRPNEVRNSQQDKVHSKIDLSRFYAEKITSTQADSDLELIVGLSRPLPTVQISGTGQEQILWPTLELYSGAGLARTLTHDESTSTRTLLVYKVHTAFPLPEGWYDPMLNVDPMILRRLVAMSKNGKPAAEQDIDSPDVILDKDEDKWDELNFTFSVGSNRRNVQLISGLVQDANSRTRGTLTRADGYATVEVQVSAGSSVLNARVRGFYQMITQSPGPIALHAVEFADSGTDGDVKADDGIYTAKIDIHEVIADTEFRIFVLADTTNGQAHYIALDDPNRGDQVPDSVDIFALPVRGEAQDPEVAARKKLDPRKAESENDTKAAEGPAIKFQRATTIHFHVKP